MLNTLFHLFNSIYSYYLLILVLIIFWQLFATKKKLPKTNLAQNIFLFIFAITFNLLPLLTNWYTNITSHMTIGGLIPYADVAYYYNSILSLTELGYLLPIGTERPFGSLFYTSLYTICGHSLIHTFLLMNLLHGIAIYFCSKTIFNIYNFLTAFIVCSFLIFIGINNHGKFILESPAFLFSTVSFALLLNAIHYKKIGYAYLGLTMLCFSQNMRLGAILTLLGCAMFCAVFFSPKIKSIVFVKKTSIFLGIIFVCLMLNKVAISTYGTSTSLASNLSYVLYGIVNKGQTWQYAKQMNPDLYKDEVSEKERTAEIYRLTIQTVKDHPSYLVLGLYNSYKRAFLNYSSLMLRSYSYFFKKYFKINVKTNFILYFLWILAYGLAFYLAVKNQNWIVIYCLSIAFCSFLCVPLAGKDNGLYRLFRSSEIYALFPLIFSFQWVLQFVYSKINTKLS